ncbi:MAG: pimeloyl-ACP methyl ester carboxylesterase [Planctomycetota bacterium]|jgi:pimeloyl-ACP methyl ester carboxylesterase
MHAETFMNLHYRTVALSLVACAALPSQQKPPTGRALDGIVAQFLQLDAKTKEGFQAQLLLLEQVAKVPDLTKRKRADWQRKISKLWSKGAMLEKSGDHWYWPRTKQEKKAKVSERGRYIVGGETKKPKGLAITMHGGGLGSGDAGSAAGAYRDAHKKLGLLMIAPEVLDKTAHGWTDSGTEEFVMDLVDDALRTFKIDPDHVYFVGHSMGGYGSWSLGGHHADRIAAIAPSAGAPTPIRERQGGPIIDIQEGVVPSLRNVFVSIYQSIDDPQVPPAPNQFAAKLLGESQKKYGGFDHVYWEVDGRGHAEPPGGFVAQLQKVVTHTRNAVPERLVWQPVLTWKRQFYWLYWDKPVINALLVADIDRATNTIAITCDQPTQGLHVLLDSRVLDVSKEVVVTVNGTETFRGKVAAKLSTVLLTSQHPDPKLQFAMSAPAFL